MKRRLWILMLALGLLTVAGCADTSSDDEETQEASVTDDVEEEEGEKEDDAEEDTRTTAEILAEVDIDKCVVLGDYKNITVEKSVEAVTDEYLQSLIDEDLALYPVDVAGRSIVQDGDIVNIDYVGTMEGEEFDGGSGTGVNLTIGSGQFIAGFEDGLIGKSKGETVVLDLTFPEGYTDLLSGKDVQFTVTINAIKQPLEEPTDEWVAANIAGYYTVEEYENGLREEQEEANEETALNQMRYNSWMQVVDNCTILEYPEPLMEKGRALYDQQAEYYATLCGMTLEEYVEAAGLTMDEYEENKEAYAEEITAQTLVNYAICQVEGFEIGDEGYQQEVNELLETNDCETEEELIEAYGQDNVEQSAMLNRVSDLILEYATIVEVDNTTDTVETEDEADESSEDEDNTAEDEDGDSAEE